MRRACALPEIPASDRRPDQESLAAVASLPAHCADSPEFESRWSIDRAWNRPVHHRQRDTLRPLCAFVSIFPVLRALRSYQENSPRRSTAFLLRGALAADLAREGATRGASESALRKCGGQGASFRPDASSFAAISSNFSSEPAALSISACGSPIAANRCGTVNNVKSAAIAVGNLLPRERRRNPRVRQRTHGVSRAGRAVLGVLVVIEEDAVALFLPPLRRRQLRHAPLHRARECHRRTSDLRKRPLRMDTHVHMHAARPARLRPSAKPNFFQQPTNFERDSSHFGPTQHPARGRGRCVIRRGVRGPSFAQRGGAVRCSPD